MKLHTHPELFDTLMEAVQAATGIDAAFVEKDYWLTSVLWELSRSPHQAMTVFKGGTSLSKAYGIIERFSEDVDLALTVEGLSGNQVKSRMDSISKGITRHVPEIVKAGITSKGSRFRRTAHHYSARMTLPKATQVSPEVILEINAFANPYPFETREISSMVGQLLQTQNRQDMITQYELQPFAIQVLKPTRTLAEKVLALVRASYHPQQFEQLQSKIRHTYDLYCLLKLPEIRAFVVGADFFPTLRLVQADDAKNSEFQGDWANKPLSAAWIYQDDPSLWKQLESTYTGAFKSLVYGELPDFAEIRSVFSELGNRLKAFDSQI